MKKELLLLFASALLQVSCAGCSGSDSEAEVPGTEQPAEGEDTYAATDMVVYEANPRLFAATESFAAIEQQLDRISSLGTTVLWLMPIYEPGEEKSVNSPYCIRDFKATNSRYGSLSQLKSLIEAAHEREMKVMLDWVANHTAWDHPWVTAHPDWYTKDVNGNVSSPLEQPWTDVADLNYGSEEMQAAMLDAMKYWVTETGIDGYRCDYAEGVPDAFWKKAIEELRRIDTDFLMLAEGGKTSLMACGFDWLYGWNFHSKLKDLYAGKCDLTDLYDCHQGELDGMPKGTLRLRYATNHDQASEVSPVVCYGGEAGALSAFSLATWLEGVPLIYSSQEVGYAQKVNFFNYSPIDLTANADFSQEMARIVEAYKETADVRGGTLKIYSTGVVASFARSAGSHGMLVFVNPTANEVSIKVPMEQAGIVMTNLLEDTTGKLPATLKLQPYGYLIYKK